MRYRDIAKENPNHRKDQQLVFFITRPHPHNLNDVKREEFIQKWLACEATLSEWIYAVNVNVNDVLHNSKLSKKEKVKIDERQKLLYDWYIEYKTLKIMQRFQAVIKYTPFYALKFAKNDINKFSEYLSYVISEKEFGEHQKRQYNIDIEVNIPKVADILASKDYKEEYNIHFPYGLTEVISILRYIQYLESFVKDNGKIEANIKENLDANKFSFLKLFPEVITLSENIIIEYDYSTLFYKDESFGNIKVKTVSGCRYGTDLQTYAVKIFIVGFERFIKKIVNISTDEKISILYDMIDNVEELKFVVNDSEHTDEESEHGPRETHYYKSFTNAKFKGNKDDLLAFSPTWQQHTLYNARFYAEAWLDSIGAMIRKLESTLNNLELIEFSKPPKPKEPTTIQEADNQTRAYYTHFRVQMGDIPADYTQDGFKVIKSGKYKDVQDAGSYDEYRKIINNKVMPARIVECCRVITQFENIDLAIISQAKKCLPR